MGYCIAWFDRIVRELEAVAEVLIVLIWGL